MKATIRSQGNAHTGRALRCWLLIVIAIVIASPPAGALDLNSSQPAGQPSHTTFVRLPLHFEANHGQADRQVKFLSRSSGASLFLTADGATLALASSEGRARAGRVPSPPGQPPSAAPLRTTDNGLRTQAASNSQPPESALRTPPVLRSRATAEDGHSAFLHLRLVRANPSPTIEGVDELPGKVNYFRGSHPAQWRTNVATFARVKYAQVYPGIDLVFYGSTEQQLEFDFIIAPGADPSRIALSFDGAEQIELDASGDLILHTGAGRIRQHRPRIYQFVNGECRGVCGGYVLRDASGVRRQAERAAALNSEGRDQQRAGFGAADDSPECRPASAPDKTAGSQATEVRFALAPYDTSLPLIIDPVLSYSTYLGGSRTDRARSIAVDSEGHAYVTGFTDSVDFPTANALDPGAPGQIFGDIFVAKLKPDGSGFVYATYIGSVHHGEAYAIAADAAGNAYVVGQVGGGDTFPTANAFQPRSGGGADGFLVKLSPAGDALLYSSYFGGDDTDLARGVAVDDLGNIYITGHTASSNFPIEAALQPTFGGKGTEFGPGDAFVAKFNPSGSALLYSTFLGGSADDYPWGIAVDEASNACVTGWTSSTDFPTANALQPTFRGGLTDSFVAKLNAAGSAFIYSTYLGGSFDDGSLNGFGGIAADASGNVYVTGYTQSADFPTRNAWQQAKRGITDAFVTKIDPAGSALLYSTLLCGKTPNNAQARGNAIALDRAGNAYITGDTSGFDPFLNFPLVNPVQPVSAGGEAFVAKFDPDGAALLFSTYLGGSLNQFGWGIAVDPAGNIFVTGITSSTDFPTKNPIQPALVGGEESFVVKYSAEADATPPKLALASTRGEALTVSVTFTEPIEGASATDASHYTIDHGASVSAATMAGNSKTVRLTTSVLDPATEYTLTVNGVQDRAPTPNTIPANSPTKIATFPLVEGKITRKVFTGVPGTLLKHLTSAPKFPNSPGVVEYVDQFETAVDALDNYGVQLKGFIQPPLTAEYVFYLCSDGEGALFLSTDETPESKALIASEPVGNGSREWITGRNQSTRGEPPSNVSAPIHLEGGRLYYVEALMKAATGGDNLAVAWRLAGQSPWLNGDPPISRLYLWSPVTTGSPAFASQPQDQTGTELQPASFSVVVDGTPPFSFQWLRNGVAIPGATSDHYRINSALLSDDGAEFSVVVSNASGSVTGGKATLRVTPDTTPPTVVRVRCLTLEQVEVSFSEPVTDATATDLSHYSLESATGSVTIQAATLPGDHTRAVLATGRLKEGTEYVLKISGIKDPSAASSEIAANTEARFTPDFADEFLGPFSNWADLNRDYGAVGDGLADDTPALQQALAEIGTEGHPRVLYVPSGTYRITATLRFKDRISVGVLGEDSATTTIKWDGPPDGVMLHSDGVTFHRVGRLTFDGSSRALSCIDHKWTGGPYATSGSEYADMGFADAQHGIRAGLANNDAEVAVLRCRFLRCSSAGITLDSHNALDWWVRHSLFEDCFIGVRNGSGACHAYDSVFRRSTYSDIVIANCSAFLSFRRNTSVDSKAFLWTGYIGCGAGITVQDNVIIDPHEAIPIIVANVGPLLLLDNVIRTRPGIRDGPLVALYFPGASVVSVGNTFTVPNAVQAFNGRQLSIDDQVVSREMLSLEVPELPATPPRLSREIIEVPAGADATTIQNAINEASLRRGGRPVVHLPGGTSYMDRMLVIPAGSDLQLVGDGYLFGTVLEWRGRGSGPVLWLEGPSQARLLEFQINGSEYADAIKVDDCDQSGARVLMEQVNLTISKTSNLMVDRLDHTRVVLHSFSHGRSDGVSLSVIGGPRQNLGEVVEGRVDLYGGSSGDNELSYEVTNGGRLMAQDTWHEGRHPRFIRCTDSGSFTLNGAMVATSDPAHGGSNEAIPAVEIEGFRGELALLTTFFGQPASRVVVQGENPDLSLLLLGDDGAAEDYFVNNSSGGQIGFVQNLVNPLTGALPLPDRGISDPAFIKKMLRQTRTEKPAPLTLRPEGVTDVRFYRLSVEKALVGIYLSGHNTPPVLAAVADQIIDEGHKLTLTLSSTDADMPAQRLRFTLDLDAPPGSVVDPDSGVFTWQPSEAQGPGTYTIPVRVTDSGFPPRSDTSSFTVTVNEVNTAPFFGPPRHLPKDFGRLVNGFQDDFDGDTLGGHWLQVGTLPNVFSVRDGLLEVSISGADSHFILYQGAEYDPSVQEALARIRIRKFDLERCSSIAGVMVVTKVDHTGMKYDFLCSNSVGRYLALIDEGRMAFPLPDTRWELNTWYWLRLRHEPNDDPGQPDVFAKIWPGAGGAPEPDEWQTWDYYPDASAPTGYSGITALGFLQDALTEFDVDYILMKAAGLPEIQVAPQLPDLQQPPITTEFHLNEGDTLSYQIVASDADLPAQSLRISLDASAPLGANIDPASGLLTWTPREDQGPGTATIRVTVTDEGTPSMGATIDLTVTVAEVNTAPELTVVDQVVDEGQRLGYRPQATDADLPANRLSLALVNGPSGATVDADTGEIRWQTGEADGPGVIEFAVKLTDDGSPSLSSTKSFKVTVNEVNSPPLLGSLSDTTIDEGTTLAFTVSASDPNDVPPNVVTLSASGLPEGASFDPATGKFLWTPGEEQQGTHEITFTATDDGQPSLSDSRKVTITVNEVNRPPELSVASEQLSEELSELKFAATASDADVPGNEITLNASGLPEGSTFDPATGEFRWTPTEEQGPGSYTVTITATDDGVPSKSVSQVVTITVNEVNRPPELSVVRDQLAEELSELTFAATASDADVPKNTLTFSLAEGAPAGTAIDPATGVFTWTPSESQGPGVYPVTVIVTDSGSPALSDAQTFTLTASEVNSAPKLTAIGSQSVDELSELMFAATARDTDVPANKITLSASGLQEGSTFDPATGEFRWIPTEEQGPGSYSVTITATDDGVPPLSASQTVTITVREANAPPVLAPIDNKSVDEHQALAFTVAAADAKDSPPNRITLSVAGLPTGASFDPATGTFTWTPGEAQQGPHQVVFTATDDGTPPLSVSETLTITVNEVNDPPTVVLVAPPPGAQFIAPATIQIEAEASDPEGALAKVEFFAGGARLGEATDRPYAIRWENVLAGQHALTAKATDEQGTSVTSAPVEVTVLASLRSAEVLADGSFRVTLLGEPDRPYAIEFSDDLKTWTPLRTATVKPDGTLTFTDSVPPGLNQRFYRARRE